MGINLQINLVIIYVILYVCLGYRLFKYRCCWEVSMLTEEGGNSSENMGQRCFLRLTVLGAVRV